MTEYELIELEKYIDKAEKEQDFCYDMQECIEKEHKKRQKLHFPTIQFHRKIEELITEYRKLKVQQDKVYHHP